jgi:hypothetical protein
LWRPIIFPLRTIPAIFYAICRLHNFLIDVKDMERMPEIGSGFGYFGSRTSVRQGPERRRDKAHQSGYDESLHRQTECAMEDPTLTNSRCFIRDEITNQLESMGVLRPQSSLGRLAAV